ncbi:MAG: cytochrome c2 [Paracoccaceae bacterium]|jgi:cytochrome c2
MSKFLKTCVVTCLLATPGFADSLGLGRVALDEEVAAWNIDVRPDGQGLPEGRGDVLTGEQVFTESCAVCHGDFGEAVGRWPALAGGFDTLTDDRPVKTIGSYWPYLSTVFDYVNRAMPFGNAQSLEADEVYAITAYILYLNDQVDDDFELSSSNFASVTLPNQDNFFLDDRAQVELTAFAQEPCMTDCKADVKITKHALVLDVTPETEEAEDTEAEIAEAPVEVAVLTQSVALDPVRVAAGEKIFRKCKSCHQVGEGANNKSGPQLNNLLGRVAGEIEGFKYSNAMSEAGEEGLIWTDETLTGFLAKPRAYLKGTKMSFSGLKKEDELLSVVEYLKSFGG